jgi:molecular chaperone DnaJ
MQSQGVCPQCGGSGKVVDKPCETCEGQGRTPSRETVEVKIPAGVHSGQTVTVRGKGEAGIRGDHTGDLVVRVDVEEDERFERQGDDLFCKVEVDSLEAIVGKDVTVDGIMEGEEVKVTVPAGCQFGQQVRVAGHGMPRMNSSARGSLIAVVQVKTPGDLTESQLDQVRSIVDGRSGGSAAHEGEKHSQGFPHHGRRGRGRVK